MSRLGPDTRPRELLGPDRMALGRLLIYLIERLQAEDLQRSYVAWILVLDWWDDSFQHDNLRFAYDSTLAVCARFFRGKGLAVDAILAQRGIRLIH